MCHVMYVMAEIGGPLVHLGLFAGVSLITHFEIHSDSELLKNWTKTLHCPTSSGASECASERSEQCGASKQVSGASEPASE